MKKPKIPAPIQALNRLIEAAGSITKLASALNMTEGGVRYWLRRGSVPRQAARLLSYEAKHIYGLEITEEELSGVE
jgi:hypothetical protein